jgi:hypothetical protein
MWSDGEPVRNASIDYLAIGRPMVHTVDPDRDGRFSIKVYAGLKIRLLARVEIEGEVHSGYADISAMGEDINVKLVVPR